MYINLQRHRGQWLGDPAFIVSGTGASEVGTVSPWQTEDI